jgi:hypothetical protein
VNRPVVLIGGAGAETAMSLFTAEGVDARMVATAAELREADRQGIRYTLVHVGPDDGEPEGTYARAHHRVESAELAELARKLRSRERMVVTCLAFAFKNGLPAGADWVVDGRFLENPYWIEELRPLDGTDARVRDYVLGQPPAVEALDNLERTLRPLVPRYRERGRMELMVAFGCTGGRHRSVVLAKEMARRLATLEGVDVEFASRDI